MSTVTKYTARDGDDVLPLFGLRGKTCVVTGAGAGIGFAVAQALAEAGGNVAFLYNSSTAAVDRARETAEKYGVVCKAYKLDITSQEDVERTVDRVVADLNGRLDVFIANAGIPWTKGPIIDANDVRVPSVRLQPYTDLTGDETHSTRTTAPSWRRIWTACTSRRTRRASTSGGRGAAPSWRQRQCRATS